MNLGSLQISTCISFSCLISHQKGACAVVLDTSPCAGPDEHHSLDREIPGK